MFVADKNCHLEFYVKNAYDKINTSLGYNYLGKCNSS